MVRQGQFAPSRALGGITQLLFEQGCLTVLVRLVLYDFLMRKEVRDHDLRPDQALKLPLGVSFSTNFAMLLDPQQVFHHISLLLRDLSVSLGASLIINSTFHLIDAPGGFVSNSGTVHGIVRNLFIVGRRASLLLFFFLATTENHVFGGHIPTL